MIKNCQELASNAQGVITWSLARLNSCHISNQNQEMGEIVESVEEIKDDIVDINLVIARVDQKQTLALGMTGAIILTLLPFAWAKIFNKRKNGQNL